MNPITLELPFQIEEEQLIQKLHLKKDNPNLNRVLELVSEAKEIARPKAVYRDCYVESRAMGQVIIDGVQFKSQVLQVNLENSHRVIPYVVTCGQELDEWSKGITDFLDNYFAEAIKELVLHSASLNLASLIDKQFGLESASDMHPGSLPDWPITEQKPLFELLNYAPQQIGVQLTESFLLLPSKSVSGIRFPKEGTFTSCQLCPREKCPSRRASYEPELRQEYFLT